LKEDQLAIFLHFVLFLVLHCAFCEISTPRNIWQCWPTTGSLVPGKLISGDVYKTHNTNNSDRNSFLNFE